MPVLARKPGALRNGAPFEDWLLPGALERVRRKSADAHRGDRQATPRDQDRTGTPGGHPGMVDIPSGQGKTWTAKRVASVRRVRNIHAYLSADKGGEWLTMTEAANTLGVTNYAIRRLIKTKILAADQVVPGAPFQIRASDLETDAATAAIARKGRPCRIVDPNTLPMFSGT